LDEIARFFMILFAGYEIFKIINVQRMVKVIGLLASLSDVNRQSIGESQSEVTDMISSVRAELGWMFLLEVIYPFAMLLILFSRYFYSGLSILILSLFSYIGFKRLAKAGLKTGILLFLLVLISVLSIGLLLFPLVLHL